MLMIIISHIHGRRSYFDEPRFTSCSRMMCSFQSRTKEEHESESLSNDCTILYKRNGRRLESIVIGLSKSKKH